MEDRIAFGLILLSWSLLFCFFQVVILWLARPLRFTAVLFCILSVSWLFTFLWTLHHVAIFKMWGMWPMQTMMMLLPLVYPSIPVSTLLMVKRAPKLTPRWPYLLYIVSCLVVAISIVFGVPDANFALLHHILNGVAFGVSVPFFVLATKITVMSKTQAALRKFAVVASALYFVCGTIELGGFLAPFEESMEIVYFSVHFTCVLTVAVVLFLVLRASAAAVNKRGRSANNWPAPQRAHGSGGRLGVGRIFRAFGAKSPSRSRFSSPSAALDAAGKNNSNDNNINSGLNSISEIAKLEVVPSAGSMPNNSGHVQGLAVAPVGPLMPKALEEGSIASSPAQQRLSVPLRTKSLSKAHIKASFSETSAEDPVSLGPSPAMHKRSLSSNKVTPLNAPRRLGGLVANSGNAEDGQYLDAFLVE